MSPSADRPADPAPPGAPGAGGSDARVVWLQRGVWAVLLAGVLAFLVRGADNPADPLLVPAVDSSTTTSAARPEAAAGGGGLLGSPTLPGPSPDAPPSSAPSPTSTAALQAVTSTTVAETTTTAAPPPETTTSTAAVRRPLPGFGEVAFRVTDSRGQVFDGVAMLAATDESRRQGLMGQTDLRGYDGMVFRSEKPSTATFYMRNTIIPLSVAFFDLYGRFVSSADMEPCPDELPRCPAYAPAGPYLNAIEVAQGDLGRLGIGPGSVLSFP